MRNLTQRLAASPLGDWREKLPLTPDALAQSAPNFYLSLVALFTLFGLLLSLVFPLTALILLIGLPETVRSAHTATDLAGLLLPFGTIAGTAAMTAFLWRQKMSLPPGQPLAPAEQAPLDKLIASLKGDTRLSQPDAVRITTGHQLASVCAPRNGFALLNRRILLMGLPTLQALTAQQTEAAIRRVLCWPNTLRGWVLHAIDCQHQCTQQYAATYRNQTTVAARIMGALFRVYWPAYQRLSAPALRWNELERDTLLVQQICVDKVLELLAVDAVVRRYLDDMFWPAMHDTAKRGAKPPHAHVLFQRMLHKQLTQDVIDRYLDDALHETLREHVASPTMGERVANLGSQRLVPVSLVSDNAAQSLFQDSLETIIRQVDKAWRLSVRHAWRHEHEKHEQRRARLEALRKRALTDSIQGNDAVTYAKLAKHYLPPAEAVIVYRQIAEMNADDAKMLLGVGRLLLKNGSADGAFFVKRATRLDARLTAKARKILSQARRSTATNKMSIMGSAASNAA